MVLSGTSRHLQKMWCATSVYVCVMQCEGFGFTEKKLF